MLRENYYEEARPKPDLDAYVDVIAKLDEGRPVSIQGGSGTGKTETLSLVRDFFTHTNTRTAYLDLRYVRGASDFYVEIAKQIGMEDFSVIAVREEFGKGDIALLLDECWAGIALVRQEARWIQNNRVVGVGCQLPLENVYVLDLETRTNGHTYRED